jgi:hypothetical protein
LSSQRFNVPASFAVKHRWNANHSNGDVAAADRHDRISRRSDSAIRDRAHQLDRYVINGRALEGRFRLEVQLLGSSRYNKPSEPRHCRTH